MCSWVVVCSSIGSPISRQFCIGMMFALDPKSRITWFISIVPICAVNLSSLLVDFYTYNFWTCTASQTWSFHPLVRVWMISSVYYKNFIHTRKNGLIVFLGLLSCVNIVLQSSICSFQWPTGSVLACTRGLLGDPASRGSTFTRCTLCVVDYCFSWTFAMRIGNYSIEWSIYLQYLQVFPMGLPQFLAK